MRETVYSELILYSQLIFPVGPMPNLNVLVELPRQSGKSVVSGVHHNFPVLSL